MQIVYYHLLDLEALGVSHLSGSFRTILGGQLSESSRSAVAAIWKLESIDQCNTRPVNSISHQLVDALVRGRGDLAHIDHLILKKMLVMNLKEDCLVFI